MTPPLFSNPNYSLDLKAQYEAAGRAKTKVDLPEMRQPNVSKARLSPDPGVEKGEYKGRASKFKHMDEDRHSHGEESYSDKDEFGSSADHRFEEDAEEQSMHSWVRTS